MKKIVSIILVVVLALSLSTMALAAKPATPPGQEKKDESKEPEVTQVIVTYDYEDVILNTGGSAKNSQTTLDDIEDFTVDVFANKGNPDGWTFDVDFDEDAEKLPVEIIFEGNLYRGNPKNGKDPVATFSVTYDVESGTIIDSEIPNKANFVNVTSVIAVYEEESDADEAEKTNNGAAHGNNEPSGRGETTGNWKKDPAAADDGYNHPGNGKNK